MHHALHTTSLIVPTLLIAAAVLPARSQSTNTPVPDPLSQLMVTQPSIEIVTNPVATASFDPPVVQPGQLSTYRVSFNALDDSIQWPDQVVAPPTLALRQSARGQILILAGNRLLPQTTLNHHVRAASVGSFTIEPFTVQVYGRPTTVPAARLEVVPVSAPPPPPGRRLAVEVTMTNLLVGQSVNVRVLLAAAAVNAPQRLAQVRFNGDGFLVDHTKAQQSLTIQAREGQSIVVSTCEMPLTPLTAGQLRFTAQGFASGNFAGGVVLMPNPPDSPVALSPEVLLDSDPVTLNVRPLPRTGALPGFTGAIGTFVRDPPQLSATRVQVGDIVRLTVTIRGEGNLARLVPPPPPVTPDWQVSSPTPDAVPGRVIQFSPNGRVVRPVLPAGTAASFTYSLIPLSPEVAATPAIPFSYFDPDRAAYADLSIPSVPIEVTPGGLTTAARLWAEAGVVNGETNRVPTLSALAASPGRVAGSLLPLQLRRGFLWVQLLPLIGFGGLWAWDRRRRYLEQHPDVVRRRRARRALCGERRAVQRACQAADAVQYAEAAVRAMRVACAPHFPAEPRALVCRDVLEVLTTTTAGSKRQRATAPTISTGSLPLCHRSADPGDCGAADLRTRETLDAVELGGPGLGDATVSQGCATREQPGQTRAIARPPAAESDPGLAQVARKFFAVADASRFAVAPDDASQLFALRPDLERLLHELEARL